MCTTISTRRLGLCSSIEPFGDDAEFRCTVTARLDLRGIDSHRLDEISLYAVGAALAQIEIVFKCAKRIRIAFHGKCGFRIALDKRAKLLQLTDGALIAARRCHIRKSDRPAYAILCLTRVGLFAPAIDPNR